MEQFKYSYKPEEPAQFSAFSVHNIGFQLCEAGYNWSGVRNHFLIHHIISGRGRYETQHGVFLLEKGDTFLIYPNTRVSYVADEIDPWEYYWLGFSGTDAISLLSLTDFSPKKPVLRSNFGESLKEAILAIYENRGTDSGDNLRMIGLSYLFLAELVKSSEKKQEKLAHSYAGQAREYIENNYSHRFHAEDVALWLSISRSHLYRVFMEAFHVSPATFITAYRLDRACGLLRETDLSIGEIANSVGFENQFYFSNVFKKHKGQSPQGYRSKKEKHHEKA